MWPITEMLWVRQLMLFGQIATLPDNSLVRCILFDAGSIKPAEHGGKRKRGRPKLTWLGVVRVQAMDVIGHNDENLHNIISNSGGNFHA